MLALLIVFVVALTAGVLISRGDRRDEPVAYVERGWLTRTRKS